MKVIILAAGRGSRLGNLTNDCPKCMCSLNGKTLLDRCIDTLENANIKRSDICIVTGYRDDMFNVSGVNYLHNEQWESTNMFYSLMQAKQYLENEICIVCYSDIVFSSDVIKKLINCDFDIAITYYTKFLELWNNRMENPMSDLETFNFDENGILTEIGDKPTDINDIRGQYMGIIRFTPKGWYYVTESIKNPFPKSIEKLDMTTLFKEMIKRDYIINTIPTSDLWLECDTKQDIEVYEKFYINQIY